MQMCNSLNTTRNWWVISTDVEVALKRNRKIQRGYGFVNERCSKWFLDCTTTTTARQLLSNVGGLVLQIPLYSAGSGLKAHLTCWAAGNQTVECTCLLSWPTSSLLFNYSRALKCSSVWPTADSPTLTGWPSATLQRFYLNRRGSECADKQLHYYTGAICTQNITNNIAQNFEGFLQWLSFK